MNLKGMLLSLTPWLFFALGTRALGPTWIGAVAVGALLIVICAVLARRHKGTSIIDVTGVLTFGVLTAIALAGGPAADRLVVEYGRGSCTVLLAAVMAVSAITVPFTEQYARDVTPQQYWRSPEFRAVNRKISGIWAGIVAIHAICHLWAGHLMALSPNQQEPGTIGLLLNWIIPIGLTLAGIRATKALAHRPRSERHPTPSST